MTKLQALAVAHILVSEPRSSAALYALAPEAFRVVRKHGAWSALLPQTAHLDDGDTWQSVAQGERFALAAVLEEIAARLREGE